MRRLYERNENFFFATEGSNSKLARYGQNGRLALVFPKGRALGRIDRFLEEQRKAASNLHYHQ